MPKASELIVKKENFYIMAYQKEKINSQQEDNAVNGLLP